MEYNPRATTAEYEFTPDQNRTLETLAKRMRLAGVMQLVFGIVSVLGTCHVSATAGNMEARTSAPLFAFALIFAGAFTMSAGRSFQRIVQTEGRDVSNLMDALRAYSRAMKAHIVAFTIAAVIALIVVLALVALVRMLGIVLHG
jgi:hypothetical protein